MRPAALMLLALAGVPHLAQDDLALLGHSVPPLSGPLSPLGPALEQARPHGTVPSVAAVRDHLAALRTLEEKARAVAPGLGSPSERATLHLLLGLAWAEVSDLEAALAIKGEGEAFERPAVRTQAQNRSDDAAILAASELFNAASEPGSNLSESIRTLGNRLGAGLKQGVNAREVARARTGELQACWEEHLLTQGTEEAIPVTATLELEAGRVVGVTFLPPLEKQKARLGACLTTRLLGWRVSDDADALELPLHLGAAPGQTY